jgi:hypothetical protein
MIGYTFSFGYEEILGMDLNDFFYFVKECKDYKK